ncbi:MAG: transcription-repair coupling factor, partial [Acidobacteriota bacterium]|nr:transcription-repair coupling factor [Acidobacteriota bacterium]
MLASLLHQADDDPQTARLYADGGRAFVSMSLRPFLIAALLGRDPTRPAIVVAGDDRQARELAGSLRAWLAPRRVRYYPSRGVTYESHLAPPAHLTGQRIAALDALLDADPGEHGAPVVVVSAVALSEKVPDPSLRPFLIAALLGRDPTRPAIVVAGDDRQARELA